MGEVSIGSVKGSTLEKAPLVAAIPYYWACRLVISSSCSLPYDLASTCVSLFRSRVRAQLSLPLSLSMPPRFHRARLLDHLAFVHLGRQCCLSPPAVFPLFRSISSLTNDGGCLDPMDPQLFRLPSTSLIILRRLLERHCVSRSTKLPFLCYSRDEAITI